MAKKKIICFSMFVDDSCALVSVGTVHSRKLGQATVCGMVVLQLARCMRKEMCTRTVAANFEALSAWMVPLSKKY